MSLKENYKNDIYPDKRKYRITNNPDGTISFDDVTPYIQEGDMFTAEDIIATNVEVNKILKREEGFQKEITGRVDDLSTVVETITGEAILSILASKWSDTAPYTQQITFPGLKESDIPIYGLRLSGTLSNITVDNQKRSFSYIDRYASGNGHVILYCYGKKPDTDIVVSVKGVKYE